MKPFTRGQRSRLDALSSSLELSVGLKIDAPGLTIDFSCFGLDDQGQLSDDRFFVFYNQPLAPAQAIAMEGRAHSDDETFRVRLENLPSTIRRLVFTATIDGVGTMAQIRSGHLSVRDAGGEVARYELKGSDFAGETALMLGEIYFKDAWRLWAVGQGFAGNLSALLKHFGGVEIVDDSPAPPVQPPARTPTPSHSAPPRPPVATSAPPTSLPVAGPAVHAQAPDTPSLQSLIDSTPVGGTLQLGHGEFEGPAVIRKAITIAGAPNAGGVIWARHGPVLTVEAPGVVLRDVEIEVTSPEDARGEEDVALLALPSTSPSLHGLRVRGRVVGAGDGGGQWQLPGSLDLGEVAPRASNSFEVALSVPVECDLSCTVAGVAVEPPRLSPGSHRIRLWAREVPPESFVLGRIEVRAGEVVRSIPLSGRSAPVGSTPVQNRVLSG